MVNGTMVAVEGETVSILCSTQSNPDPILTIFKEKQILATVIYESELQLELPAVTPEDDGEYWCVAENQYGQRATAFNLSVECEYPAPLASPPPADGRLDSLSCRIPRLGRWFGGGARITGTRPHGPAQGQLGTSGDDGEGTCHPHDVPSRQVLFPSPVSREANRGPERSCRFPKATQPETGSNPGSLAPRSRTAIVDLTLCYYIRIH